MAVDVDPFHFPPDVHQLLVDVIPRLCRNKNDVLTFFQGAGCDETYLATHRAQLLRDPAASRKHLICRDILMRLNERGDAALRVRREVVKRVVEFEDYSTCWPNDILHAQGLVAQLRRLVNVKDSFTRMKAERERERQHTSRHYEAVAETKRKQLEQLGIFAHELGMLAVMPDRARRGKALENLLNRWFEIAGVHGLDPLSRTVSLRCLS